MGILFSRVPKHSHLGYTYEVDLDEVDGEVRKIIAHFAMKDGRAVFVETGMTYHFMSKQMFREFIARNERMHDV